MKGLRVYVLRNSLGDCTNGGVSSHCKALTLVGDGIPEIFEADDEAPACKLVKGPLNSLQLVPVKLLEEKKWVMFGGNFAHSSDSRFAEAIKRMGFNTDAVKIFDRVEDVETTRRLSI